MSTIMSNSSQQDKALPFCLLLVFTIAVTTMVHTFTSVFRTNRRLQISLAATTGKKGGQAGDSIKINDINEQTTEHSNEVIEKYNERSRNTKEGIVESDGRVDVSDTSYNVSNDNWRCACEGGFLPPGLLKTFGNMESVYKMGIGNCYHKNNI